MEYCHCGSIASYLRRGNRLNEEELRAIASCCLLGLSYLHKRNVAHRVFIIAFLWVIGYQTRQLAPLRSGSGETGWFRTGEWTGRIVHETTGCVWYFTVHGTRSVRRRCCVEEWCVVVGNQFDRNGRGQESLRWSRMMIMKEVLTQPPLSLSPSKWSSEFVDFVNRCLVKDVECRGSVEELMGVRWVCCVDD